MYSGNDADEQLRLQEWEKPGIPEEALGEVLGEKIMEAHQECQSGCRKT